MARYIVIEVDDNETAGDLVAALQSLPDGVFFYKKVGGSLDDGAEYEVQVLRNARVRALYAKPVQFCECPDNQEDSVRGVKLGLYVHRKCGKPKKNMCQHPRNLLSPEGEHPSKRDMYLGVWEPAKLERVK